MDSGKPDALPAFVEGFLIALALATILGTDSRGGAAPATIGGLTGIVLAVTARARRGSSLHSARLFLGSAAGALAAMLSVAAFLGDSVCMMVPLPVRIGTLALLAVTFAICLLPGAALRMGERGRPWYAMGLEWFAVVELLTVLASPFGAALVGNAQQMLLSFIGAVFFGVLLPFRRLGRLALVTAGATLAFLTLALAAAPVPEGPQSLCVEKGTDGLVVLVSYLATVVIVGMAIRPFRARTRS